MDILKTSLHLRSSTSKIYYIKTLGKKINWITRHMQLSIILTLHRRWCRSRRWGDVWIGLNRHSGGRIGGDRSRTFRHGFGGRRMGRRRLGTHGHCSPVLLGRSYVFWIKLWVGSVVWGRWMIRLWYMRFLALVLVHLRISWSVQRTKIKKQTKTLSS